MDVGLEVAVGHSLFVQPTFLHPSFVQIVLIGGKLQPEQFVLWHLLLEHTVLEQPLLVSNGDAEPIIPTKPP